MTTTFLKVGTLSIIFFNFKTLSPLENIVLAPVSLIPYAKASIPQNNNLNKKFKLQTKFCLT